MGIFENAAVSSTRKRCFESPRFFKTPFLHTEFVTQHQRDVPVFTSRCAPRYCLHEMNCRMAGRDKILKSVKIALIAQLKVDEPRPYCNRREVIVTLKDGSERCLDPQSKFTIMLLEKL
uniref:Chemokine interleukin-8-like domain-containing protein n=1 Tax=Haplochromis burtoni TaxID=8153 RepID=A0A3Q2VIM1_HAPBU